MCFALNVLERSNITLSNWCECALSFRGIEQIPLGGDVKMVYMTV